MESKNDSKCPDRLSTASALRGFDEEPTSTSKLNSIALDLDDSITDSFFDSISECHESILVQKVPKMNCTVGQHHTSPSPGTVNLLILSSIESNNVAELIDIISKSSTKPNSNYNWEDGNTFLHIAVKLQDLKVCEALLDYLDDINIMARNKYLMQPLHIAVQQNDLAISQLLVRSGADLNPMDIYGNTPLHYACIGGFFPLVSWLLSRGPDVNVVNGLSKTAKELADDSIKTLFKRFNRKTMVSNGPSMKESLRVQMLRNKASEQELSHQFVVLKQIGKGSFGEVFLVKKGEELFAMKVLQKDKILAQNLIIYARTERNILSQMHHPFMVSLNFAFQTSEKLFLILNYCPGGDLSTHLRIEKRFSESRARIYISEMVLAIEHLHNHDIIFRDLKPDNILLDADGHAILTDFGLSKVGIDSDYKATSFCGSMAYLAPEVLKRNGHGKAVDWYLLGVVFYEMIIGIPPYFSRHKEELLENIQKGRLKIPGSVSTYARDLIKDVSFM